MVQPMSFIDDRARRQAAKDRDLNNQISMNKPRAVVIEDYFPSENRVTIRLTGHTGSDEFSGPLVRDGDEPKKFPIAARSEQSEAMGIRRGDVGLVFYVGMQIKNGFVMLFDQNMGGDGEVSENAGTYVPVRGRLFV